MIPELGIVLDAGTGMFRVGDHLQTDTLEVYLTHAHLDHVVGLTYLLETLGLDGQHRATIHGTQETLTAVREHLFAPALFPIAPSFGFAEYETGESAPGGAELTTFPLAHPGGSVGLRFDWAGRSLAYVTDTTASATAGYVEHIRGVDLLVHEANFPAGYDEHAEVTGHSCLDQVAHVAAAAQVGRLILVHSDPLLARHEDYDLSAAREIFAATDWVGDGESVEI